MSERNCDDCWVKRHSTADAEREWLIEVDVDVCDCRRPGSFPGGSILLTLAISDGDIEGYPLSSVTRGSHLEAKEGSRARHVTEAIPRKLS